MSISYEVMQKQLSQQGFHERAGTKKVTEYSKYDSVIYVNQQGKSPKLILSPSWVGHCEALLSVAGVASNKTGKYFHNSNLKKFPMRRNRGLTDIHYGLAFSFDNTLSLASFLERMSELSVSK